MRAISCEHLVLTGVLVLVQACGGRVDVAKLDRELSEVNANGEGADGESGDLRDYADFESACYDPNNIQYWDAGEPNYMLEPTPDQGCEYHFTGNDDACEGRWTCCGNEYRIRYERDLDKKVVTTTAWGGPRKTGGTYRVDESELIATVPPSITPSSLVPCPLKDEASPELSEAAALAGEWFGYTPAWEQAVREARGETVAPGALDPIPLGCSLWMADYGCHARLTCPEHDYEVRTGLEGEAHCSRDGEVVAPFDDEYPMSLKCGLDSTTDLYAFACFGPGWDRYFAYAAEYP